MICTMLPQDAGILSEAIKAAPSAVSTVLVIVVVWAFLKHERARDARFAETLDGMMEMNKEQRESAAKALDSNTERMSFAMATLGRNMEQLANGQERVLEAQSRVLEAVHGCAQRNQA